MKKIIEVIVVTLVIATLLPGCKKEGCTDSTATNYDSSAKKDDGTCEHATTSTPDISTLASKFYNSDALTFAFDDNWVTITATDEPDHESIYYPVGHALYEAYTEPSNSEFNQNPNFISEQNYTFTIPRYPAEAATKQATASDAIGVTINGVVFFNQHAGPGDDIFDELNTFDQYEGHPQQQGAYHYHLEPTYLTQTKGNSAFLGLLLDGFPVYGPVENGVALTSADLDDYHGHVGVTTEFPEGIYHYHITSDFPWINGDGYYGTPGTKTN